MSKVLSSELLCCLKVMVLNVEKGTSSYACIILSAIDKNLCQATMLHIFYQHKISITLPVENIEANSGISGPFVLSAKATFFFITNCYRRSLSV
jgi:hypothetical protein